MRTARWLTILSSCPQVDGHSASPSWEYGNTPTTPKGSKHPAVNPNPYGNTLKITNLGWNSYDVGLAPKEICLQLNLGTHLTLSDFCIGSTPQLPGCTYAVFSEDQKCCPTGSVLLETPTATA